MTFKIKFNIICNHTHRKLGRSSALHIGDECLSIYGISIIMPKNSVYAERLNNAILRMQQSGLIEKLHRELQWVIQKQRGGNAGGGGGALLKATQSKQLKSTDVEDRGLTLADTEGMFLLMGIGYLIGASVLVSEVIGGCANRCRKIARRVSVASIAVDRSSAAHPNSSRRTSYSTRRPSGGGTDDNAGGDSVGSESLDILADDCNGGKSASPRIRKRRKSDQTEVLRVNLLKGTLNGHRRHNSLVTGLNRDELQSVLDIGKRGAVRFANELRVATDGGGMKIFHVAEINRAPTPFVHHDENDGFGEAVYH